MLALEGRQLGNYDVIRRIRIGGMGAVYEGRQRTAFDRRVAIKVILGNFAADREMRRRFAREARTVARLHHPHILPLIEFGDEQGILFLVMPFIDGGTLTSYLRRSLPDLSDVAAIFLQLLDAVEYAHDAGLIHRDIKSSNVLLELRRSGPPYVYLADFGLVRTSQQAELEQRGTPIPLDQVPGTPHYMAPEQTHGIVTTSTDIYALGVLLYQMLVGELPYDDPDEINVIQMHLHAPIPTPCAHDSSIPFEIGEVVRTAMAKRAEDRFQNIAEFREAFLAALDRPIAVINEDILSTDEIVSSVRRPVSLPLTPFPPEPPAAMILPRRVRSDTTSRPLRERQRVTDAVKQSHKRFTLSVVAAMLVPTLLLILLIMPRVLGISLFPAGFPLFGASPVATITVTAQSKQAQNTYFLTAMPQIKNPDLVKRVIPDRLVLGLSTVTRTVQTTGTKVISGTSASGVLLFDNSSTAPVTVQVGNIFVTNYGVQIRLAATVTVPPKQNGQDGTITGLAMAVNTGPSGNIAPRTLATPCCNAQVFVTNPEAFTGGQDASVVHVLTQADLDNVRNSLEMSLQRQVLQQIQKQMNGNEVIAGSPVYNTRVYSNSPVGGSVNQVQVQINVFATVPVYNNEVARHIAAQLFDQQFAASLGNFYQLRDTPTISTPKVVQIGPNGTLYLSITVHGLWLYHFTSQQISHWSQSLKDALPTLATDYLKSQQGVETVYIQLPFGTDHLPSSTDQIQILVNY